MLDATQSRRQHARQMVYPRRIGRPAEGQWNHSL